MATPALNVPYDLILKQGNLPLGFCAHDGWYRGEINTAKNPTPAKFIFVAGPTDYYAAKGLPGATYIIQVQMSAAIPGAAVQNGNDLSQAFIGVGGWTAGINGNQGYLYLTTGMTAATVFAFQTLADGTLSLVMPGYGNNVLQLSNSRDDAMMDQISQYSRSVPGIILGGGPAPAPPAPPPPLPDTDTWFNVINLKSGNALGTDTWRGVGAITIKTVTAGNPTCKSQKFMFKEIETNYGDVPTYLMQVTTDGLDKGSIPPAMDRETDRDTYVHVAFSNVQDNDSDEQIIANWRPDIGGDHWGGSMLFLVNDDRLATEFHFEQTSTGFALYTIVPGSGTKMYLSVDDTGREVTVDQGSAPALNQYWKVQRPEWMRRNRILGDDLTKYIPNDAVCQLQTEGWYYCNGFGQSYDMRLYNIDPQNPARPFKWEQNTNTIILKNSALLQYVPGKTTRGNDLVCMVGKARLPAPSISHTSYLGTNDLVEKTAWSMNLGGSVPTQYGMIGGAMSIKSGHEVTQHQDITTAEYNYKDLSGELNFVQDCFHDERILDHINPKFIKAFADLPVIDWVIGDWVSKYVKPTNCAAGSACATGYEAYQDFFTMWGTHMLVYASVGKRFIMNESVLGTTSSDLRTLEAKACMELAPIGKEKKGDPPVEEETPASQDASSEIPAEERAPIGPPPSGITPNSATRFFRLQVDPPGPAAELCGGYDKSTLAEAMTRSTTQSRQVWGGDATIASRLIAGQGVPISQELPGLHGVNEQDVSDWMNSGTATDDYTDFEFMPLWELLRILSEHTVSRMAKRGAGLGALQSYDVTTKKKIATLKMAFAGLFQQCVPKNAPGKSGDIVYLNGDPNQRKMMGTRVKAVSMSGVPEWGCWAEGFGCKSNSDCGGDDGSGGSGGCACACKGDGCSKLDNGIPVVSKEYSGHGGTSETCHQDAKNCAWAKNCLCDNTAANSGGMYGTWSWEDQWN